MDDTVVFATSRESMMKKLRLLKTTTDDIGMLFHPTKCQFITVNFNKKEEMILDEVTISHTNSYAYLGAIISDDNISAQVANHISSKQNHIRKFTSFLSKNSDCPYSVKYKVWTSALNSAIFYSCETWLTNDLKRLETPYMSTLKQLLSVRHTTCNELVNIETSLPNGKSFVMDRQTKFLQKLRSRHANNNYIIKTIDMAINCKSPMGKIIQRLENVQVSYCNQFLENLKQSIRTSDSSRRKTYLQINPNLEKSPFLKTNTEYIPNENLTAVNRIRLISHHLKIETGRWSRTPVEERICSCGMDVQTEEHVLVSCPQTQNLRTEFNIKCS